MRYVDKKTALISLGLVFLFAAPFAWGQGAVEPESKELVTATVKSKWVGTAPFCGASAEGCSSIGYDFWLNNNFGDGAACATGHKVLCVSVPKSEFKRVLWFGTGPYCSATPEDCTEDQMEFIAYGTAGDGPECASGKKVLCAVRK